jgi:hypothetical protein
MVYGKVNKYCKLIITEFNGPFLCIISTSTDSHYVKYIRYKKNFHIVIMFVIINT